MKLQFHSFKGVMKHQHPVMEGLTPDRLIRLLAFANLTGKGGKKGRSLSVYEHVSVQQV